MADKPAIDREQGYTLPLNLCPDATIFTYTSFDDHRESAVSTLQDVHRHAHIHFDTILTALHKLTTELPLTVLTEEHVHQVNIFCRAESEFEQTVLLHYLTLEDGPTVPGAKSRLGGVTYTKKSAGISKPQMKAYVQAIRVLYTAMEGIALYMPVQSDDKAKEEYFGYLNEVIQGKHGYWIEFRPGVWPDSEVEVVECGAPAEGEPTLYQPDYGFVEQNGMVYVKAEAPSNLLDVVRICRWVKTELDAVSAKAMGYIHKMKGRLEKEKLEKKAAEVGGAGEVDEEPVLLDDVFGMAGA